MNLETRTYVLEKALLVEKSVNDILLLFLNIEIEKKKALTNKSGGLSFKNKIDLLFDIEVFDEKEYMKFLLLMEFRNQFMHNYDCNTFIDSLKFLGSDKKNKLLNYSLVESNKESEENLKNAYGQLQYEILKILKEKFSLNKQLFSENKIFFEKLNNQIIFLVDKYFELSDFFLDSVEPKDDDSKELLDLKSFIFTKIHSLIQETFKDKRLNDPTNENFSNYNIKILDRFLKTNRTK